MKEYFMTLSKGISKGLRSDSGAPINSDTLVDALNVRVGVAGLDAYTPLTNPVVSCPAISRPWPQVVDTSVGLFLVSGSKVYSINSTTWALTEVVATLVASTNQFSVADFGLYQVWTNGNNVLVRSYLGALAVRTAIGGESQPSCVCNFRGQLLAGFSDGYVGWGDIGSVNLATLFGVTEAHGTTSANAQGIAGQVRMVWARDLATIYRIIELGNGVVVYGSRGITYLKAVSQPVPTFGVIEIHKIGVKSVHSVCGDSSQHIFLDKRGNLYRLGADLKLDLLGYKEFLGSTSPIIFYDDGNKDFYISGESSCYLLSPYGMSRVYQIPTTIFGNEGTLYGVYSGTLGTSSITSGIIDMGLRGIKTLSTVEIGSGVSDLEVSVDYQYSTEGFASTEWREVNSTGVVYFGISANEFKINVRSRTIASLAIDYINLRWKLSDKRAIRGLYTSGARE